MRCMFGRKLLRTLARIGLAAFLFAQVSLAIAACQVAQPSAAQAIQNAGGSSSEPCHEQGEEAAALCVAHCVTQAQSLEKPFWKSPAPAAASVVVLFVLLPPAAAPAPAFDTPFALAGPPRRILFRTLLI